MTFSIIIPVYNVAEYLEKCVRSVLEQDRDDYEIILVDDGSTDSTSGPLCDTLAATHPERIAVIHQANGGLGAARNTGLEAARGEYVFFLDSDDYILPDMLRTVGETIAREHCDIVDFGFTLVEDDLPRETHISALPHDRVLSLSDTPELLLAIPSACIRVWRRTLFLDSDVRFPARVWYEDMRTTFKLFALADSVVSLPQAFYCYVARSGSITRNTNAERNAEILEAFSDLLDWYRARGLWEQYHRELYRLAVDHILIAASVRVLRVDPRHPLLQQFQDYVAAQFPNEDDNPYLAALPQQHKLILHLLRRKHYRTIKALFDLKEKL